MLNTYNSFKTLANLYKGTENLTQVAMMYKQTEDPVLFAHIFCDIFPLLKSQADKYFYITEEDKASIILDEICKAIYDYEPSRGVKLQTFITAYINRALYATTKLTTTDMRKANNSAESYDVLVSLQSEETIESIGYKDIELGESLAATPLTENEMRYCRIVMNEPKVIKDAEIARKLGMSSAGILWIKSQVKKKLLKYDVVSLEGI